MRRDGARRQQRLHHRRDDGFHQAREFRVAHGERRFLPAWRRSASTRANPSLASAGSYFSPKSMVMRALASSSRPIARGSAGGRAFAAPDIHQIRHSSAPAGPASDSNSAADRTARPQATVDRLHHALRSHRRDHGQVCGTRARLASVPPAAESGPGRASGCNALLFGLTAPPAPATCGTTAGDPMPDLLLELFSEEIPARMQARAAEDLRKLVTDQLVDAGLVYEGAKAFATPRRLALAVQGVPVAPARREGGEERPARRRARGRHPGLPARRRPHVDRGGQGQKPDKKGDFYVAVIEKPGRPAIEVIGRDRARGGEGASPGRSRCAGASARPNPARSAGCGRCIPSSRPSGRRPRSPRSSPSRSTASRPATRPAAIASWRRSRSRCAGSTTTPPSSRRPRSCSTPSGASR